MTPLRIETKLDNDHEAYLIPTGSSSGSSSSSEDEEDETCSSFSEEAESSPRLIPATHPLKMAWDIITFLLSLWNAYLTHVAIRDRSFAYSRTRFLMEVWFVVDIVLNFITERRVYGTTLRTFPAVSGYYLTTWFPIDVMSLLPGELLFVTPVLSQLQKRKRITKWWNRIKIVGSWTRKLLRDRNIRHASVLYTRRKGVRAASKMVRLLTFYIPKYWMFVRNMKAVVGFRILRLVRLIRNVFVRRVTFQPLRRRRSREELRLEDDDGSPY